MEVSSYTTEKEDICIQLEKIMFADGKQSLQFHQRTEAYYHECVYIVKYIEKTLVFAGVSGYGIMIKMPKSASEIRVRMAPSPTGFFHVGTARTTIFNWLFAKANNGTFVLRIEDTDKERNKAEFEEDILEQMKWLGISWDEFYKQSERTEIYKDHLKKLIDGNKAYYCFCSKEDLDAQRQEAESRGAQWRYSGLCRSVTNEAAQKRIESGEKAVIRFRVPEKEIAFKDLIRGEIKFDAGLFGDLVIARDINNPLYNFVVVIDDILMEISHVIRGEDHLSNTPKQILLYEAFGRKQPMFAHLPLILNPDRSKMSKRFLDVSLKEYRADGYLREALFNFIAFLGWHPKEDKEVMTIDELIKEFDLERVQKGGAVFNIEKLNWLNQYYISQLSDSDFISMASEFLPIDWKLNSAIISSVKNRVKKMSEIRELVSVFFELPDYGAEMLKWKGMTLEQVSQNLGLIRHMISDLPEGEFTREKLETLLPEKTKDKPKGEIFWPLRVALSGKEKSPTPFEIMAALGKNEALRRIELAIKKCETQV